jgi:hypothetical protein
VVDVVNRGLLASLVAAVAAAGGLGIARAGPAAAPPTLEVAGVVRDAQGRPIPRVWIEVEGRPGPMSNPPAWPTDVNGRFRIDGLPAGPLRLLVTMGDFWKAKKSAVETRAGVRDLAIVLDPGPQLLLKIVGFVPGPVTRGARVTWAEPDGERHVRWTPLRDDGWARFVALPPDREFEVWAEAAIAERIVRARGLKPGNAEQRIEAHEVRDIAGKVRPSKFLLERGFPGNYRVTIEVYAHRVFRVDDVRVHDDGTFRVRGLPPGTYDVVLELFNGGFDYRSLRVEAGTTDVLFDLERSR